MKKAGQLLLTALLLLSFTACAGKETPAPQSDTSLYQKGLEMTTHLDFLAESREYTELYSSSPNIVQVIDDISSYDYSRPRSVYALSGIGESVLAVLSETEEIDIEMDPVIQKVVEQRLSQSLASQLNASNGVETLAATSILTTQDCFLYHGLEKQTTYLYLYEEGRSSIVTFNPYEDDIVQASAMFVSHEALSELSSPDDVSAFLEQTIGLINLTIEEIKA